MSEPTTGQPCEHHAKLGFIYSVIGCPKCYPAPADHPVPVTREPLTDAWGAMLEDVIGLWGTGQPDKDDVLDTLAEHRPYVDRPVSREQLSRALDDIDNCSLLPKVDRILAALANTKEPDGE